MNPYEVRVTFHADDRSVSVSSSPAFPIAVSQGISLFTFTLDPSSGAEFPGIPIHWMKDGQAAPLPSSFLMHWHDEHHFALWDFNSSAFRVEHRFVVSVFYNGQFYSSPDPTIINDPPGGGEPAQQE